MHEFLSIQVEDIAGEPPITLFTMETNIQSVQTTISRGWEDDNGPRTIPEIIQNLERLSARAKGRPGLMVEKDGRVAYKYPSCPKCNSKEVKLNGCQGRKLKACFNVVLDLSLQKYRCKTCRHHFKVNLDHIVPKYGHYTVDVRAQASGFTGDRALSLGETADLIEFVSGVRPTREAIRLWKLHRGRSILQQMRKQESTIHWSGIYSYDEQYILIKGRWWYRCLIYDVVLGRPVSDLVVHDLEEATLREFLRNGLRKKPVHVIVTDGGTKYPDLIKELFPKAARQLCVIHFMFNPKFDTPPRCELCT